MLGNDIQIKQLVGVGDVHLNFEPEQRVYCLIGENGIGKTRCLEALFRVELVHNEQYIAKSNLLSERITQYFNHISTNLDIVRKQSNITTKCHEQYCKGTYYHNLPVVFLGAQFRGATNNAQHLNTESINLLNREGIGSKRLRINEYFDMLDYYINNEDLKSLNMNTDIQKWISQRAQSANPYQAKEDNREVEIITLLSLLNQVDERIDAKFLEIAGDNRVFIKVAGKKTELSELSSGFVSLLKIMQSIIAGYSYFTNETNIASVKGVVFIDEIESHLHTKWQANIIPTLKRLFPNTTFYITTHSAIVISQLQHGEAYELYRDEEDRVVKTKLIEHPNNAAFVDLLKDAFDIDINRLKLERDNAPHQKNAKKLLSELLEKRISELKEGAQ